MQKSTMECSTSLITNLLGRRFSLPESSHSQNLLGAIVIIIIIQVNDARVLPILGFTLLYGMLAAVAFDTPDWIHCDVVAVVFKVEFCVIVEVMGEVVVSLVVTPPTTTPTWTWLNVLNLNLTGLTGTTHLTHLTHHPLGTLLLLLFLGGDCFFFYFRALSLFTLFIFFFFGGVLNFSGDISSYRSCWSGWWSYFSFLFSPRSY